jgi:hypothetical protein
MEQSSICYQAAMPFDPHLWSRLYHHDGKVGTSKDCIYMATGLA